MGDNTAGRQKGERGGGEGGGVDGWMDEECNEIRGGQERLAADDTMSDRLSKYEALEILQQEIESERKR